MIDFYQILIKFQEGGVLTPLIYKFDSDIQFEKPCIFIHGLFTCTVFSLKVDNISSKFYKTKFQ